MRRLSEGTVQVRRRRQWAVVVAFALVVAAVAASLAGAALAGGGGQVGLTAVGRGPLLGVVSVDTRTGVVRRGSTVPVPADASEVLWSPDGRKAGLRDAPQTFPVLAWFSGGVDSGRGGALRRVVGLYPTWSPDGGRLAFCSSVPGGPMYVADVRSGVVRQVATKGGGAPVWSPDGLHLAFHDGLHHGPVFVLDVRSGRVRRVAASGGQPEWSPDGRTLAWGDARGVLIAPPFDGRPRFVLRARLEAERRFVWWSPDGRRIAVADVGSLSLAGDRSTDAAVVACGAPRESPRMVSGRLPDRLSRSRRG